MSARILHGGWFPPAPRTYAYLLGIYLGDGCLSIPARKGHPFLQVALDAEHPAIVEEVRAAIDDLLPDRPVHVYRHKTERKCVVQATYQHWTDVFPQHGPGPKHERPIELWRWQRCFVDAEPEAFLRGLIHSDGCRTVNRFTTTLPSGRVREYAYPRYFFSNRSADILRLFCDTCDRLGIRWTRSSHRNVSVSHRASVAALDAFVGPKG